MYLKQIQACKQQAKLLNFYTLVNTPDSVDLTEIRKLIPFGFGVYSSVVWFFSTITTDMYHSSVELLCKTSENDWASENRHAYPAPVFTTIDFRAIGIMFTTTDNRVLGMMLTTIDKCAQRLFFNDNRNACARYVYGNRQACRRCDVYDNRQVYPSSVVQQPTTVS